MPTPTSPWTSTPTGGRSTGGASGCSNRRRTGQTTASSRPRPPSRPRCATPSPPAPRCRSAPTTASTACSPAATWPVSTSPQCPRSSLSAATCATPPTPPCSSPRRSSRPPPPPWPRPSRPSSPLAPGDSGRPPEGCPHQRRVDVAPGRGLRGHQVDVRHGKGGVEGNAFQLGLGPGAQPPLDPGQGEVAVEGRSVAGRFGDGGRGGPAHRQRQRVEPVGGGLEDPHPGEPGGRRSEPALDRARQRGHAGPEAVAHGPELVLGQLTQGAQRDVPPGRADEPQVLLPPQLQPGQALARRFVRPGGHESAHRGGRTAGSARAVVEQTAAGARPLAQRGDTPLEPPAGLEDPPLQRHGLPGLGRVGVTGGG